MSQATLTSLPFSTTSPAAEAAAVAAPPAFGSGDAAAIGEKEALTEISGMLEQVFSTTTENGAPAVPFDGWKSFVDFVASPLVEWIGEHRESRMLNTVAMFEDLYGKDPKRASLICMAFQTLRKGGGGLTNKDAFFACLDVLWRRDPMFVVRNIEVRICSIFPFLRFLLVADRFVFPAQIFCAPRRSIDRFAFSAQVIAENGSYNLVNEILLHVSNPDTKKQIVGDDETGCVYTQTVRSAWNYWGLELDVFANRKEHWMSYRPEEVRQYVASLECWMSFQREKTREDEQKAVDKQQLRRLQKCERRLNVFREFLWWMRNGKKQLTSLPSEAERDSVCLEDVVRELLVEKTSLQQKMYIVYDTARVPKNGAIADLFERYIPIYEADPPDVEGRYEASEFGETCSDEDDNKENPISEADPPDVEDQDEASEFGEMCPDEDDNEENESLGTRVSSNAMIGRSLAGMLTRPGERKLAEQVAALEAVARSSRSEEQEQQLKRLRRDLEYVRVRNTKPDLDAIRELLQQDPRWQKLYDQARAARVCVCCA